jgi:hypothetical protein
MITAGVFSEMSLAYLHIYIYIKQLQYDKKAIFIDCATILIATLQNRPSPTWPTFALGLRYKGLFLKPFCHRPGIN